MSVIQQPIVEIGAFKVWQEVVETPVRSCSGQNTTVSIPVPDSYFLTGPGVAVEDKYPSVDAGVAYINYLLEGV